MISNAEGKAFVEAVISTNLLDDAVSWLQDNVDPVDVFTHEQLSDWALENGFTEEQ